MATISSIGIGSGLDIKSIVSQLVALEKQPLEKLQLENTATQAKVTLIGQIKSLVDTLNTSVGKLTSVTGWNSVAASSSSDAVSVTAIGGTQTTSFDVEVQQLATARATASQAFGQTEAVGAGTLKFTVGSTTQEIVVDSADTVADIASKINGVSGLGVSATVMTDPSTGQQRLMLRGSTTGASNNFTMSVTDSDGNDADSLGLSRLSDAVSGAWTDSQTAKDAQATINGISVTSSSNTFENVVAGVTLTVNKVTSSPATVSITKDTSAMQKNIQDFVDAYNAVNSALVEATKYDKDTQTAGAFQGDSTMLAMQSALRAALQTVSTSGGSTYTTLSSLGIETQSGGNLTINSSKLSTALSSNPDLMKNLFASTASGSSEGIAVKIKSVTTALLSSGGWFERKDDALDRSLDANEDEQTRVNNRASQVEEMLNKKYSALDATMTSLNSLSTYLTQQMAQWNKSSN